MGGDTIFPTRFTINVYIPTEYVSFSFGFRLENSEGGWWDSNLPNLVSQLVSSINKQLLDFFNQNQTPRDFVQFAPHRYRCTNSYVRQAMEYSLAHIGDYEQAVKELSELIDVLDYECSWMRDMADEASKLREFIKRDPDEAQKLLLSWEAQTIDNLGLREFVSEVEPK
jgi:hypothetical protein